MRYLNLRFDSLKIRNLSVLINWYFKSRYIFENIEFFMYIVVCIVFIMIIRLFFRLVFVGNRICK